jgi:DEAD/DEAH box helicase domain-containing protein
VARRAAVHIVERVQATKRIRVRFMGMERIAAISRPVEVKG